jgi:hypothetical protein
MHEPERKKGEGVYTKEMGPYNLPSLLIAESPKEVKEAEVL